MNRLKQTMCVALVAGSGVGLGGQAGTADKPSDPKAAVSVTPTTPVFTATGCIAKDAERGRYRLTNAEVVPSAMPVATGTSGAPTLDAPSSMEQPTTYALYGNNLKAHLGHKVEVTGTASRTHVADAKPTANGPATPAIESRPTIDVTSLKMLSTTCP